MNRLKGTRAYLSGAMGLAKDFGVEWRVALGKQLKELGVIVLDPCDKPIDIGQEKIEDQYRRNRLKRERNYDKIAEEMKLIRCVDLRMVDICDFIIVNVDLGCYTVGTWEEIFLGNRQKKPIIVRVEQGKEKTPDWLLGTLPHEMIFSTWEEVNDYLNKVNSGDTVTHYKRWYFFNLEPNDVTGGCKCG